MSIKHKYSMAHHLCLMLTRGKIMVAEKNNLQRVTS